MPPRPLRPKDEPGVPEGGESSSDPKSGKRRAVSSACIPCRKRKSKCDGNLPSCSTCVAVYRTECYYDADSDHRRKGALRRDLQSLQQQNDALAVIVASLRTLPEDDASTLLQTLRSDSNLEALAASLSVNTSQHTSSSGIDPSRSRSREPSLDENAFNDIASSLENPAQWFRTPQDPEFVDHLLKLYFSWVHPFYHFFSRDPFLQDMNQGRTEFCSKILVNAVLALACHYSDRPAARTDPDNPATAGNQFFAEAKRALDLSERSSLTTVQALGIMSVRECSKGRDSLGYQYAGRAARMGLELGMHLSVVVNGLSPAEIEVRKVTFWAVFNVETICAVGFGRLSQLPRAAADIAKPLVHEQFDAEHWQPYEDTGRVTAPNAEQTARPMLFIEQLSKLCELACDMVNTFYAPQERFTSRRLVTAYNQYRMWYRNLPDCYRLENTTMPHVLVLHMYYHACILHLFRPYIKLDLRGANLFPRDTCTFCANEISVLMNALRSMYGLRRVCLAVSSLLLSASTIHLLNLPAEPAVSHLTQGMHDFKAMSTNHVFAGRCVEIVRSLATKWNISLPESAAAVSVAREPEPSSEMSSPAISQFFSPVIARQPSTDSGEQSSSAGSQQPSPFGIPSMPPASVPRQPSSLSQTQSQHQHQQQQKQQAQYQSFFQDAASPTDSQGSGLFWTPFPAQSMPAQAQGLSMSADTSQMNQQQHQQQQQQQHWTMYEQQQNPHHGPSTGTSMDYDESMGENVDGWPWER